MRWVGSHGSRSLHLAPDSRLEHETEEHVVQLEFELKLVELVPPGAGLVPG